MNESIVRRIVREILKEAQIGRKIQDQINNLLDNSEIDVIGDFEYSPGYIMKEVKRELDLKIKKVAQRNFEYTNFYIVKLGNFIVKEGNKSTQLAFKNPNFDKNVSAAYLYIYQDRMMVLRFGSRFYDTDEIIRKSAEKFIKDAKINLTTMSEKGQIIFVNDFDTDNIIDLTDYSKVSRPKAPKKEVKPLKQKADYRAGSPYNHPNFGKGIVVSSKKFGVDEEGNIIYDVIIDFKDFGQKKLRLKSTKKRNEKITIEPGLEYIITGGPFKGAKAIGIDPETLEVDVLDRKVTISKYQTDLDLEPMS